MKALWSPALLAFAFLFSTFSLRAQFQFYVTFRGTSCQTDSTGRMVTVPVTERTLLEKAAQASGATDIGSFALVYHFNGSSFGDTIDVVNATNGATYTTLFGFFFGEDPSLLRTAITNASGTEVRRLDYVYTKQNSHSMGAAFLTKRFVRDVKGTTRTTIDAQMHWIESPEGNASTKICEGSFTTTKPFK